MREQSLIIRLLTVLVAGAGNSGYAISYCSSSFRFDQLCPDPRFGSREAGSTGGGGSIIGVSSRSANGNPLVTDTYINLNTDSQMHRGGRVGGGGSISGGGGGYTYSGSSIGYGGKSYTSSMSVKDPSTTSCEFHRNGVETAVVTAIHVTEKPWSFQHANQCVNIVKLNYELFDGGALVVRASGRGTAEVGSAAATVETQAVCQKEIGFRRKGSQDEEQHQAEKKKQTEQASHAAYHHQHHHQGHLDEEIGKKMNVYFWHNFTLYQHSAKFVDTITNYHWSKEEISCVGEKHPQYVQIVMVVSKSGRCENIVQQYKIDEKRSPFGCPGTGYPIPYPIRFCGSYDCSQSNGILTSLKLLSRRDTPHHFESGEKPHWNNQGSSRSPGEKVPSQKGALVVPQPPHAHHRHHDDSSEGTNNAYTDYEEGAAGGPPCVTDMVDTTPTSQQQHSVSTAGDSADQEEDGEEKKKPMDWMEALFLVFFPAVGIVAIVAILMILRSRSAREICRGYSYPRPYSEPQHMYIPGSFTSIDKSTLRI